MFHHLRNRARAFITILLSCLSCILLGCNDQIPVSSSTYNAIINPEPLVEASYTWIELGPQNKIIARAIIEGGSVCPRVKIDDQINKMHLRATSPIGFEAILVCEFVIPRSVHAASINDITLTLPKLNPKTIVIVGDTGCRVKGSDIQDCTGQGTGVPWNFAQIADAIADTKPDLIIHVGDYHYREYGTCDANCLQSNIGYSWTSWQADFFAPAKNILAQAPWVFIRGNHEDCERAWKGWFYLLDPSSLPNDPWLADHCQDYTDPYRVSTGPQDLLIMDSSEIPGDYAAVPDPKTVTRYAQEFDQLDQLTTPQTPAWLLTHRPIWAIASFKDKNGSPAIAATDLTLQTAIAQSKNKQLPNPPIEMLITGHVHQFELLQFTDNRPPQFVFGGGATELDPTISNQLLLDNPQLLKSLDVDTQDITLLHDISFGVIQKKDCGWSVNVNDQSGSLLKAISIDTNCH